MTVARSANDTNRLDDHDDDGDAPPARSPLALGMNGDPVDVPDGTIGWRVSWRKLGERGGSPSLVYAAGRPLVMALDATADDLVAQVGGKPGRYRLDPVDDEGRVIDDATPAYAVIERGVPAATAAPPVSGSVVEDLLRQLMQRDRDLTAANQARLRTLQECFAIQSQQIAQVVSACGALVSGSLRRVEIQTAPQASDWGQFLQQLAPHIIPLLQSVGVLLGHKLFGAPGAPTSSPVPPPTPGT